MTVGVIGDVHGDFSTIESIMKDNSEIKCWLCTGDLADKTMEYFSPPAHLYWISGNHENWDKIEKLDRGILKIPNLVHLANAETFQLGKTRILGLGGNYSPTYYVFKKAKLPKGRERHYVESEIQKCMESRNIEVLITHEAPSPITVMARILEGRKSRIFSRQQNPESIFSGIITGSAFLKLQKG